MNPLTDEYLNGLDKKNSILAKRNLNEVKMRIYKILFFLLLLLICILNGLILNFSKTFQNSLYEMLRRAFADAADQEIAFAWKSFLI